MALPANCGELAGSCGAGSAAFPQFRAGRPYRSSPGWSQWTVVTSLDLNADVGEGFPYDEALLDVISSANVACGFHAGDPDTMRWLCELCAEKGVAVGAQVSYRDRAGFGRRDVEIGYDDLLADLVEQRETLRAIALAAGAEVGYLKPHGALYNRTVWDGEQARAVAAAADGLPILGLPGSVLLRLTAEAGTRGVREFFADRGYTPEGTLVPRADTGAVLSTPAIVRERVARLVDTGAVTAADGSPVAVEAESICVHGDTRDAVGLARAVAWVLSSRGIAIEPFA
jgi:5-oxoprolinase (ATP-hydrolysing) subunit A